MITLADRKPYTCTEVTVECRLPASRLIIRLWLGTSGLPDWETAKRLGLDAVRIMEECESAYPDEVVEFARARVPLLNAVQVRTETNVYHISIGVMGYTQPFEDNDAERFVTGHVMITE